MTLGMLMAGHADPFVHADSAALAEELGFTDVWMADERFYREVYSLLTVIAMKTKRINIGPCVTDPFSRHPALTAMAIYTLDDISRGRAILGLGAGVSGFAEMGTPRPKPVRAIRESIELIRAMSGGEEISYNGEVVKFDTGKLGFKPSRQKLPVWIAGNGPQVQQLGGKLADAVIMEACGNALEAKAFAARIAESAAGAGRSAKDVHLVARLNVSLSDNAGDAYDALRLRAARTLASGRTHFDTLESQGLAVPAQVREKVAHVSYKEGAPPYEAIRADISNDMIKAISLVGTTADIRQQLIGLFEAGIGGVILSALPAKGVTMQQTLERFVTEAWQPALKHKKN